MNDDLISRKALIYNIRKVLHERSLFHICPGNEVFSLIMYEIDHAPTAFDKEKVIEELNDAKDDPHDDSVAEITATRIWNKAIARSIKIVEKGGIE